MYEWKDIEAEIENYFKDVVSDIEDGENLIPMMKAECQEILKLDIENACERIKGLRSVYGKRDTVGQWFRLLVYCVIYQYLSSNDASLSQGDVLKKMGLPPDEFTKHWDMYSPDFKLRQKDFNHFNIGFAKDEVESNAIYVAMIHHMVSYADIATGTFLDIFGKMGVVPALCAGGYSYRKCFIRDRDWVNTCKVIYTPAKMYKQINHIQKLLQMKDLMKEKQELILSLKKKYIIQVNESFPTSEVEKAAMYFFLCYFYPQYWEDSKLEHKVQPERHDYDTRWDIQDGNYEHKRIREFENLTQYDIQKLALFYKKIEFINYDIRLVIKNNKALYEEYFRGQYFLYIDIPKYFREQRRYGFSEKNYLDIIKILQCTQGNWILTWKNYIYKVEMISNREAEFFRKEEDIISLLSKIREIQSQKQRTFYVYKYRQKDRNSADSLLFITNIDFKEMDETQFNKFYHIQLPKESAKKKTDNSMEIDNLYNEPLSGKLIKQKYDNFYKTTIKYFSGKYKYKNEDEEKKRHELKK